MEAIRRVARKIVDASASPEREPAEAVMRRVLEQLGAIVWEGDPETYAFTYVSPAAERLLGFPAKRWIEEPKFWVDHIHPDDRAWVLAYCHEHTARIEAHEFDYRMLTASGQVVWLRDVVRVEGKAGRPVRSVGVMVDVTSLKQAEARAEQAAAQFRSSEQALVAVLGTMQAISEGLRLEEVIDRVLGSAIECGGADHGALLLDDNGTVIVVAEGSVGAAGEITTAHADEPIALRDAGARIPASVVQQVLCSGQAVVIDDVREDPRFVHDEYLAGSAARSLLCMPIIKRSEQIGALVLENHQTARAFTEVRLETLKILLGEAAIALDNARLYSELERGEAQWRSLVDGVPDVITLLDAHGRVEFSNRAERLTADASLDASSAAAWRTAFAEVVATGEHRELEVCLAPPGGPRQWFMTRIAPIEIAGRGASKTARYLSISTEITARKHLEAQLRQQQRLESLGTLASGVAHEINNPVQGILNYAELLTEHPSDPETVREFAGEITHESNRVAAIVRNLLAFSRQEPEQQQFEHCGVRPLIEDTLSLINAVLRKDQITVDLEVPDELPPIRCRVQQIQQVIMNLVTNARDALNERYEQFDVAKRISICARAFTRAARPWVRISVADRGAGIPEAVRGRIFDPFFTTKGRDQGTGLGLAVSHGIVVDHGGELSVESVWGLGSTFHLELPADAS